VEDMNFNKEMKHRSLSSRRGRRRVRLLNKVQNVQVSDTTEVE
jgi:hypothetical protein